MKNNNFAPREIFEKILEYAVIPTFDLLIEYGNQRIILVKRKIPPYQNHWALPGLRMLKGESIDDTLKRIAKQELGLHIDTSKKILLGQYVGKFKTEHIRQDISTGYAVKLSRKQKIILNSEQLHYFQISYSIPQNTGAMYKYYLNKYKSLNE